MLKLKEVLTLLLLAAAVNNAAGYCFPVYGTWVSQYAYHGSPAAIDEGFAALKARGINRVYFNVYANGKLFAQSATAESNGLIIDDRLTWAVESAQRHGLELYAWFEYGTMAGYGVDAPFSVIAAQKDWLLYNLVNGVKQYTVPGYGEFTYLDPTKSAVRSFLAQVTAEVVRNYPGIKGVQYDDHFSAPNGFSTIDNMSQTAIYGLMDDFIVQIRDAIKGVRPDAIMSFAPSPLAFSRSHSNVDWAQWITRGFVMDAVVQYYYTTAASFETTLQNDIGLVGSWQAGLKAGIRLSGSSSPTITPASEVNQMINFAYSKNLKGISFWFADNLIEGTFQSPPFNTC